MQQDDAKLGAQQVSPPASISSSLPPAAISVGPDALLDTDQAAAFLGGLSPRTLEKWRVTGNGPPFVELSAHLRRYRRRDLIAFADRRLRRSTSDRGEAA